MTNPSIASDLIERLESRVAIETACGRRTPNRNNHVQLMDEAQQALSQLTREVDDILDEADFLCARLRELENELSDDHTARQFYGHVAPSLARMEALSRSSGRVSDATE